MLASEYGGTVARGSSATSDAQAIGLEPEMPHRPSFAGDGSIRYSRESELPISIVCHCSPISTCQGETDGKVDSFRRSGAGNSHSCLAIRWHRRRQVLGPVFSCQKVIHLL